MKLGLGMVTCNRKDFFEQSLRSVLDNSGSLESLVVVNDGEEYYPSGLPDLLSGVRYLPHAQNTGVGISKNDVMRALLDDGCDVLFVMEDDIIVKDGSVFERYVSLMEVSGVKHFNFGYHGPANKKDGSPLPRLTINYGDVETMALNGHCVGALSMYTREVLDDVGLMDEKFKNAWEHVEHTLRIIQAGYHPPFWWFADLKDSHELLGEIACSEENSSIRPRSDWRENITRGAYYFQSKHGHFPTQTPTCAKDQLVASLKEIKAQ